MTNLSMISLRLQQSKMDNMSLLGLQSSNQRNISNYRRAQKALKDTCYLYTHNIDKRIWKIKLLIKKKKKKTNKRLLLVLI